MVNETLVKVLKLWCETMKMAGNSGEWIAENQMWIYPFDSNYVVYSHPQNKDSFSLDLFLASENISVTFSSLNSIENFIKNPIIVL